MKRLLLLLLIMSPFILFAQDAETGGLTNPSFLTVMWKLALVTLAGSFSEGFKHIIARTFSFKIWWRDDLKNAVIAFVITIALAAVDLYVKVADVFIEQYIGQETDAYNYTGLAIAAALLAPIVKGFINIGKTRAKYAK